MDDRDYGKYKRVLIILTALVVLLEIPGALDISNKSYGGFSTTRHNTVREIDSGSPAEQAGFQVGDLITSNGGISPQDNKKLSRRPRAEIGDTRTYIVQRNNESVSLDITFSGLPTKSIVQRYIRGIIGLAFLFFCLRAYLKVQTKSTTLLSVVGLCMGFLFINHPHIASYELRMIFEVIFPFAVFGGMATMLYFMMAFPTSKAVLERSNTLKLLYAPAVVIGLMVLCAHFLQPDSTSGLSKALRLLFPLVIVGYMGCSVIAMAHSYRIASSSEKTSYGLNFMLVGTVLGLSPFVITIVVRMIDPMVIFPGGDFYMLTFVLLPLSFSLATVKKEMSSPL